jgi:hypothetical protein
MIKTPGQIESEHPDLRQSGFVEGAQENIQKLEAELSREIAAAEEKPGNIAAEEKEAGIAGPDQQTDSQLEEARKSIQEAAKNNEMSHELIAGILNQNVNILDIAKQGSAFEVKQSLIEEAKKNAEDSKG